jgi:hypothetical protein
MNLKNQKVKTSKKLFRIKEISYLLYRVTLQDKSDFLIMLVPKQTCSNKMDEFYEEYYDVSFIFEKDIFKTIHFTSLYKNTYNGHISFIWEKESEHYIRFIPPQKVLLTNWQMVMSHEYLDCVYI